MKLSIRATAFLSAWLAIAPAASAQNADALKDPMVRKVRDAFRVDSLTLLDTPIPGPVRGAACTANPATGISWCATGTAYETSENGAFSKSLGYHLDPKGRIVHVVFTRREYPLERAKYDDLLKTLGARFGGVPVTITFQGKTADGDEFQSLIAVWGGIKLVRLGDAELRAVAAGGTAGRGPLVDHRQDPRASAQQREPVFKIEGSAGYVVQFRSVTDVRTDIVQRVVYPAGFADPAPGAEKPEPQARTFPLDPAWALHADRERVRREEEERQAAEARRIEEERKAAEERVRRAEEERKAAIERVRREEEERKAAAERARREEEERTAAAERARVEAEKKAAEDRVRAEAERKAAEEIARRTEAERKAAEERARRAEAERKAAEERARAEAERKAAEERVRAEAERKAAEERARRAEAERKAAEERRLAEERARAEAEKKAAEERRLAEERARAEAERKAAEERRAMEERARRAEAEYKAAVERARRAEAERMAAEERVRQAETERKAADERAKRIESERKAADERARREEQERKVAEERAKRIEAERRAAEDRARSAAEEKRLEEARRIAAERARLEEIERRAAADRARREEAQRKSAAGQAEDERRAAEDRARRAEAERQADAARRDPGERAAERPAARERDVAGVPDQSKSDAGPASPRAEWLRMAAARAKAGTVHWVFNRTRDRISDDLLLQAQAVFTGGDKLSVEIAFECNIDAGKRLKAFVRAFDARTKASLRIPPEDGQASVVRGSVILDEEAPQTAFIFPERDERQASIVEVPVTHEDIRKNTPRAQVWLRHFQVAIKLRLPQGEATATIFPYDDNLRRVLEGCVP